MPAVESSWNVMAHGDAREGKWRWNWQLERVASTLHTTSEHGVSSITTADARTSAASSRTNWRPRWFKWTRPFRQKTKSGFLHVCHHISNTIHTHFLLTVTFQICVLPFPLLPHFWRKEIFAMTYVVTDVHYVLRTWTLAFIAIQECQYLDVSVNRMLV